jgi:protein-arginine kinase activator protein McsA
VMGDEPICQLCQARRATVSFSCWRSGRFLDRTFVCLDCAPTYETLTYGGAGKLAKFVASAAVARTIAAGINPEVGCPGCGKTLAEVLTDAAVGCEVCYERFADGLASAIKSLQPWGAHVGKTRGGG